MAGKTTLGQMYVLARRWSSSGAPPSVTRAVRLFATGSYDGSFKGELEQFRSIVEREAQADAL